MKTEAYEHFKKGTYFLFETKKNNTNILKAIKHFKFTLKATQKNKQPEDWAVLQEVLGFAYYSLKPKSNLKNTYLAIDHLLKIFTVAKRYRQKQIEQVYLYVGYLSKRLIQVKNTDESKKVKFKNRVRKISRFFDQVLKEHKVKKRMVPKRVRGG